jgi:hypothetical protein
MESLAKKSNIDRPERAIAKTDFLSLDWMALFLLSKVDIQGYDRRRNLYT